MVKLKCWKKIGMWEGKGILKGEYMVEITKKSGLQDLKTFPNKKSAEKFIKNFKKKHDIC